MPVQAILKYVFTAVLLFGVWWSGRLEFSSVEILVQNYYFTLISIFGWVTVQMLGAVRWWSLLKGINIDSSLKRVFQLHMTGTFFNTCMPGAVGGDLVKATYIYLDHDSSSKTNVLSTIFIDRILGLLGLFMICGIVVMMQYVWGKANSLGWYIILLTGLIFGIFYLILSGIEELWLVRQWIAKRLPGSFIVQKLVNAFIQYSKNRRYLIFGLICSVLLQGAQMIYFWKIAELYLGHTVSFSVIAFVFPIGTLSTILPITPAGIGVGHLAFDHLFTNVGMNSGASIYNIYIMSILFMNLSGGLFYLFLKKRERISIQKIMQPEASI